MTKEELQERKEALEKEYDLALKKGLDGAFQRSKICDKLTMVNFQLHLIETNQIRII